ncbi:MAG: hypothetical protein KDA25_06170 [Phycisphaerales bacterium]|nr:hypothetical protein [Phycisphaerales bacterium]
MIRSLRHGACIAGAVLAMQTVAAPAPLSPDVVESPLRARPGPADQIVRTLDLDAEALAAVRGRDHALVRGLPLPGGEVADALLRRVDVLEPGARLVVSHLDARGRLVERPLARPDTPILAGTLADNPDARIVLALSERGVDGLLVRAGETVIFSSGPRGRGLDPVVFRAEDLPHGLIDWTTGVCRADEIDQPLVDAVPANPAGGIAGGGSPPCRQAAIALETDTEYLAAFGGDTGAAATYALLLATASSEIYTGQTNLHLTISFLRLWDGPDPWDGPGAGDQLTQFRDYWVANMGGVDRVLAHFLSPRGLGGGVAWLGAVCNESFGYAVSGNLNTFFPYPLVDHSGQNWDIMVFTHELGHNFGAPHTHNYEPPLDGCGLGDCSEAYGSTIMSYCHTCPGGMSNMVLQFHPTNVATILSFLDDACDLTPGATGPAAIPDYVTTPVDVPITIDVLANDVVESCRPIVIGGYDQQSLLGGVVTFSADSGPDGRDELTYSPPPDFTGTDVFEYASRDTPGEMTWTTVHVDVFSFRAAESVVGDEPGADAAYYALTDPEVLPDFDALVPETTEVVATVNFPSTNGAFAGSGRADDVGAVFTGYVDVPETAVYTLFIESDDGSRLLVGDTMLIDNDGLHGMVEKAGAIALAAGRHTVRIEFFERGGGAGLIARIAGGGLSKQVIGAGMWSHGGVPGTPGDLDGDGSVGPADLAALLAAWGPCSGCAADLDGDGTVGPADLALLLANWT